MGIDILSVTPNEQMFMNECFLGKIMYFKSTLPFKINSLYVMSSSVVTVSLHIRIRFVVLAHHPTHCEHRNISFHSSIVLFVQNKCLYSQQQQMRIVLPTTGSVALSSCCYNLL